LPGNVALAVKPNEDYVQVEHQLENSNQTELLWVAQKLVEKLFENKQYSVKQTVQGSQLSW
jgi:isoleucyl-tRNA synthetase